MSLSALLALALVAAAPRLEASVAAGAGYDSNLNHAAAGSGEIDASFGFVGAAGGVSLDLGPTTSVFAGLRLDGERYLDTGRDAGLSDLGTTSAALEAALVQDLGRRAALILAPSAFRTWTGDPARDATGFSARLTLRWKPVRHVALRAFYSYAERAASDPVFSSRPHRLGGSAEWNPHARTYLSVGYFEEYGDEVYYRSGSSGGMFGPGRMVTTFGGVEAERARATTRAVAAALETGIGERAHLFARYELRRVTGDEPTFVVHAVTAGIGARM